MAMISYRPNHFFSNGFEDFLGGWLLAPSFAGQEEEGGVISPRVEIREESQAIVLKAEVPGIPREDLQIEVNQGVLTLSGEKREERSADQKGLIRSERVYGTFKRSFTLPDGVEAEAINAAHADGVLTLTLPKKATAKPRQISIGDEQKVDVH